MTDRDPLTIAREMLEIDTSAIGGNIVVDGVDVLETTRNAQTLARAVIAAADLVDELREAADKSHRYCKDDARDAYQDAADRITAALNGAPDA